MVSPGPTVPPAVAAAEAAAAAAGKGKPKATQSPAPIVGTDPDGLEPIVIGASLNWDAFTNGSLFPITVGPNGVAIEPYVAGERPTQANPNPGPIAILPDASGTGFYTDSVNNIAANAMQGITSSNIQLYKQKLAAYYSSPKAFRVSYSTKDKDINFQNAIKRAINELSLSNFGFGSQNAKALQANPKSPLPANLYSFDSYVLGRPTVQGATSESSRSSGLTKREDALAEFYRTVQQYVGDPKLVNNLSVLAEAYWQKLNKAELSRGSSSTRTTNEFGNSISSGVSYTQLSDVDRLEMRIGFITKGGFVSDKKGNKKISKGIIDVDSQELQDAGGLIGDTYTKLIEHSYDMGISVNRDDLIKRSAETLLPGGSIDEQKRSMTQAAKAIYKSLGSFIDGGGKVSDIGKTYSDMFETELEKPKGSINIFNDYVQKALRSDTLPTDNDYIMGIRTDANLGWKYTSKANEASAGFLDALLKTWGKVG